MSRETWYLSPRDPLVIGDGRGPVAFVTRKSHPLPLPGTVAGMVRASFVQDRADVSPQEALELLRIEVSAPWLVQFQDVPPGEAQEVATHHGFVPADARAGAGESGQDALYRGRVVPVNLESGEGVLWPPGFPDLCHLILLPERTETGDKLGPPRRRFWPLDALVSWSLGKDPNTPEFRACVAGVEANKGPETTPDDGRDRSVRPEQRIHVGIEDSTQTADPSILFSSAGQRMASRFAIAVEVDVPDGLAGMGPGDRDWVVLGGESRPSRLVRRPGSGFPTFDDYRRQYEAQAPRNPPGGLRLQLLSHAYLPPKSGAPGETACLPSWVHDGRHPALPAGLRLRLVALCIDRALAASGWNLQGGVPDARDQGSRRHSGGAPREVRRLVPAGSVYYFQVRDEAGALVTDQRLVDVCKCLWWERIDPEGPGEQGEPARHRAGAGADGYGRVLPGFWWPDRDGCPGRYGFEESQQNRDGGEA